eukprot:CAMPEP_0194058448 /NCGR_PEP_ID=MMETSP0009_2-20130614/66316_1 /TAXON_ID=210454 /ORGANISM="Grammatophora oceanica, Strain CCMP 410" /LENGTH=1089 /DNA_ID=CAMNT_0038708597 /DNA_START=210 /DNA_END=3476 /DNA_ORIENTATION=-
MAGSVLPPIKVEPTSRVDGPSTKLNPGHDVMLKRGPSPVDKSMWDYVLNSANTKEEADGDYIYSVARSEEDTTDRAADQSVVSDDSDRPRSIRWDLPRDERGGRGDDRSEASFLGFFSTDKPIILSPQNYSALHDLGDEPMDARQDRSDIYRPPFNEARSGPASVASGTSDSSQPLKSILRKKLAERDGRDPSSRVGVLGFRTSNERKRVADVDKGLTKKEKFARLLRNRRIKMIKESEPKFKLGQYDDKEEAIFDATTFFPSYEEDEDEALGSALLSDESWSGSKDLLEIVGSLKSDEESRGSDGSGNSTTKAKLAILKLKSGILGLKQVASLISGASTDNSGASTSSAQKEFNERMMQDPNGLTIQLPVPATTSAKTSIPIENHVEEVSEVQPHGEEASPTSIKDAPMTFKGEDTNRDSFFHDLATLSPVDLFLSGSDDAEKRGSKEFWRNFFIASKDEEVDHRPSVSDQNESDLPANPEKPLRNTHVGQVAPSLSHVHREIRVVGRGVSKADRRSEVLVPVLISIHQRRDEEEAIASLPTHPREVRSLLRQAEMSKPRIKGRKAAPPTAPPTAPPFAPPTTPPRARPIEKKRCCDSPEPPTKTVSVTRPSSPGSSSMVSHLSYPGSVRSRFGRGDSDRSRASSNKKPNKRRLIFAFSKKMKCAVPCAPPSGRAVDHFPDARVIEEENDSESIIKKLREGNNDIAENGALVQAAPMPPQTITVQKGPMSLFTYEYETGSHMDIQYAQYSENASDVMKVRSSEKFRLVWGNANNVCVKVEASTISETDCKRRRGDLANSESMPLPIIPGGDIVGKVFKINSASRKTGIRVGDRVMSLIQTGGNSRYAFTDTNKVVKVPDSVDPAVAVCLLETYLSAFQALHIGHKPGTTRYRKRSLAGKTILIVGANTNIGMAMIELAKEAGASLIHVVCKEKQRQSATKLGVSPLSRRPNEWISNLRGKVDFLFDVTGDSRALHEIYSVALMEGGHYVFLDKSTQKEKTACPSKALENNTYLCQRASRLFFHNYDVFERWETDLEVCKRDLQHLVTLLEKGLVKPKVVDRLPLTKVARAHEILDSKRVLGTLVCEPW